MIEQQVGHQCLEGRSVVRKLLEAGHFVWRESVTRANLGIGHPIVSGNRSPVRYRWVSKVFPSIPLFVFSVLGIGHPREFFGNSSPVKIIIIK